MEKLPLLTFLEKSKIPWAVKSVESRFAFINEPAKDFLRIPDRFDFEGRLDEDFTTPWSEMAQEYRAHDRKAESSQDGAEIITTSYFTRHAILEPWYCHKFPIYDSENQVTGTLFYAKRVNFISIYDFFDKLKPSVISFNPPVDIFTDRELEIIFYAIQNISAKLIATKLNISHRTVENRLLAIYNKTEVNSLNGLIKYCHNVGLNNYVPKKLLREGVDFCW
ncbi:helix-turn-helix transcriptional regulator [Candidatus Sodalis endolongispinus]|uniref:Helix-turn-helix transcriptional regulator n=1 Tax=Candidatus Sodalis endolongispinus TaxID=2812662 RepID=A0ABS5Y9D6_9GAMM|nr:helix-turn-helix transcriptional regulator [Candidatus Sodalis endolongispinus]